MHSVDSLKGLVNGELSKPAGKISIIKLVDLLVEYGYSARASDIHIQPAENIVNVRLRIDGILQDVFTFPEEIQSEVISRIKVLANLKTDIHQTAQDGRMKVNIEDAGEVDIRVSIAPTYYDENAILRILAQTARTFTLGELGFDNEQLRKVKRAIQNPYGMILANGPTGSGKTTTLYTLIKQINTREISIITIEDPIEYSVEGVTQIPVNSEAGLNFANGLRSILRQDPNVIMVGEIRDQDTANIAVNAALTGHLMFSTLHTNDAATTFPRLIDMGIPPFLVSSTLNLVIAQRLVRRLCDRCKVRRNLSPEERSSLGSIPKELIPNKVYTASEGCSVCNNLGYKGRAGIFEILTVDEDIKNLIVNRANASEIKRKAEEKGMTTMVEDGLKKTKEGITSIEEVVRIIYG